MTHIYLNPVVLWRGAGMLKSTGSHSGIILSSGRPEKIQHWRSVGLGWGRRQV